MRARTNPIRAGGDRRDRFADAELRAFEAFFRFVAGTRDRGPDERHLSRELVLGHHMGPLAHRAGYPGYRKVFVASAIAAERREAVLLEVGAALRAEGCRVALIKGVAYADRIYDDPAERPMGDIDLLVPEREMDRAGDALVRLGFRARRKRVQHAPTHHALTFDREHDPTSVDLHRNIIQPWRSRLDAGRLWDRVVPLTGAREGLYRLADTDELLFHLVHIARHELFVPALAYLDAARLLELGSARRDLVLEAARKARLGTAVAASLALLDRLLAGSGSRLRRRPWTPIHRVLGLAPPGPLRRRVDKALLVQGPRELIGLLAVGAAERLWPWEDRHDSETPSIRSAAGKKKGDRVNARRP